MRQFCLPAIAVVLTVTAASAQKNTSNKTAIDQEAIKEVTAIETSKIPVLVASGPAAADWFDTHDDDNLAYQDPDAGVLTKARVSAELRSGTRKPSSIKQYDHRVRVYDNGRVAVVTYLGDVKGKKDKQGNTLSFVSHEATTDVWVKEDSVWKRVAHAVTRIPKE